MDLSYCKTSTETTRGSVHILCGEYMNLWDLACVIYWLKHLTYINSSWVRLPIRPWQVEALQLMGHQEPNGEVPIWIVRAVHVVSFRFSCPGLTVVDMAADNDVRAFELPCFLHIVFQMIPLETIFHCFSSWFSVLSSLSHERAREKAAICRFDSGSLCVDFRIHSA